MIDRDPTPSQFGFKWEPSTKDELKNYEIREQLSRVPYPRHKVAFWNKFLPALESLANGKDFPGTDEIAPTSRFRGGMRNHFISTLMKLIILQMIEFNGCFD